MASQEQANRTADLVLELMVWRRREKQTRALHIINAYGDCHACGRPYPCETIKILDSNPPIQEET